MSLAAGATLLSGLGHLATVGQFAEMGQAYAYQREQMQWTRRAYALDSRALRIDLLNAVKEDVRDHHQTYAGRIDTLLLVHTLLLTFALGTLQYSDQFVPSSECIECEEFEHPWLVMAWVYSVSGILILPFWSIVMLIWSKLQLDHWLERSLGRLNLELQTSLSAALLPELPAGPSPEAGTSIQEWNDSEGKALLEAVEGAVGRLSIFVSEHQKSFRRIWHRECCTMIRASTVFLWASCALAIGITAGMFWLFLRNHMQGAHDAAASHFAGATVFGMVAPVAYVATFGWSRDTDGSPVTQRTTEVFEDCIELPSSAGSSALGHAGNCRRGEVSRLRAMGRRLIDVGGWAVRTVGRGQRRAEQTDMLESEASQHWARMPDEGLLMSNMPQHSRSTADNSTTWHEVDLRSPS